MRERSFFSFIYIISLRAPHRLVHMRTSNAGRRRRAINIAAGEQDPAYGRPDKL
jgi:hypothetical protein